MVAAQWSGKTEPGVCGALPGEESNAVAARLWSGTCQTFCRNTTARTEAYCASALREYCATHTTPGAQDPICNCYMPSATYHAIREKANESLGPAARCPPMQRTAWPTASPLVQKINEVVRHKAIPEYCGTSRVAIATIGPTMRRVR